jgi:uncharacterized protein YdeI (YjbR/CyaY-like superfamily)
MERDPRIDDKIAQAAPFARPILEHFRALVHRAVPEAGEAIKWGMPHFTYKGKNIAGMGSFKAHCAFMIHGDGRQKGEGMGSLGKIASLDDLPPEEELVTRLREAQGRIDSRGSAVRNPKAASSKRTIEVPADFAAALADNRAAHEFFDGLSPSARYEYLEWITGAKRPETRARRIEQAVEWLAEGKRRNWKYEKC